MALATRTFISRRAFLRGMVGCAGTAFAGGTYMRFLEPAWLRSTPHRLALGTTRLARTIRLAHISDLHASPVVPYRLLEKAAEQTEALGPDLICLTGDFITRRLDDAPRYAAILSRLSAAAPTFAVPGNHDGGAWAHWYGGQKDTSAVLSLLDRASIDCLLNRAVTLDLHGQPVRLVGLGDWWAGQLDARRAFDGVAPRTDAPTIVLSHNPDTKDLLAAYPWDLLLSGHTHGGQLSLPLIGTPFAPVRDQRYVHGLKAWNERWIHVTSGVGNLHGLRLNCPPEVSLIELTA